MITKDSSYERQLDADVQNITPLIDSLKKLTADNEEERKNIILVKSSLAIRMSYLSDNFAYLDTSGNSPAVSDYYYKGRKAMHDCIQTISEMHAFEGKLMEDRQKLKDTYQKFTSTMLIFTLVAFCIICILLFALIIIEYKKRTAYQDDLQAKIIDLERSHIELEQIAYAASHDLQEPLRKIQVFSNRLVWIKNENIDEDSKHTMDRIRQAASRMQQLIEDLANVANLSKQQQQKEQTDINVILSQTVADLDEKIEERAAIINISPMPVVMGYPGQIKILFKALLDNALKFTRDDVSPVIKISVETVLSKSQSENSTASSQKKYYRIDIADNGIGFDNKFSHKLFQMFQRLHTQHSNYQGKGIGLAMCQRIMANHNGFIEATGHPKTGATFKLFFPVDD